MENAIPTHISGRPVLAAITHDLRSYAVPLWTVVCKHEGGYVVWLVFHDGDDYMISSDFYRPSVADYDSALALMVESAQIRN